jgi:hypothetical protein
LSQADAYDGLLADIAEGVRLHYEPTGGDVDLALLQGDQLYARGLSRLAELGDLSAITELADVISLVAQARAAGNGELAHAVWDAGVVAVCHGADEAYREAKALARSGSHQAVGALRRACGSRAAAGV